MNQLKEKYTKEVLPELINKFGYSNVFQAPKLVKIVVNSGIGKEFRNSSSIVEEMFEIISIITGQKPVVINSRIAISNFKLREGTPNGIKVTLRNDKMWDFLYKLINFTLPRVKDFRGVSRKSFDKQGNYTIGFNDHTIFPEIDSNKFLKLRSLQVVVNFSSKSAEESMFILEKLGMPFQKENNRR